ncbi:MAG: hypothetical protein WEE64_10480 [Dehalococcoidia bacterium]
MLDLVFRHKVLLIVPVLLGLVLGIAWFVSSMKDEYVSDASIKVERPSFLPTAFEFNPYLSAAQNQTEAMVELLPTDTFSAAVLARANDQIGECGVPALTYYDLLGGTSITPAGNTIVSLSYRSSSRCVAPIVVQALYDEYTGVFDLKVQADAEEAVKFYTGQLDIAAQNQVTATGDFRAYVSTRPEYANIVDITKPGAEAIADEQYLRLSSAVQIYKDNYQVTLAQLQAAQDLANASTSGSATFELYDPPNEPNLPIALGTRAVATKPVMGLAAGLIVSAGLFFVLWRRDRTVRMATDLNFLGNGAPVMSLPTLRSNRRRWPRSFVRLATGLTNGMNHLG